MAVSEEESISLVMVINIREIWMYQWIALGEHDPGSEELVTL